MTSTISEDALKGQQSRIMAAMRAATQPAPGSDLRDIASALQTQNSGGASYFDTMKKFGQEQAQTNLAAETGIYAQMKEQVARGDAEASAVDKAITDIAGADPKIYASIADRLHADPEPVNTRNAQAKVMKYAAEMGIVPVSVQKDNLDLQRTRADINKTYSDLKKAASGGDDPAAIREFKKVKEMSQEDRDLYFATKRTTADDEYKKSRSKKMGAAQGEAENELLDLESTLPELENTVDELNELGKISTYTKAGRIYDAFNRQLDREPRESAVAREKYINMVRDQVFPLLRQTFGAQFTKAEGDALLITLGDPDKAPKEKEAALDAFIAQKKRDVKSKKRRVGKPIEEVIPEGGTVTPKKIKFSDLPE